MGLLRGGAIVGGVAALAAALALLVAPGAVTESGLGDALAGTPVDTVAKLGLALVFGALGLVTGLSGTAVRRRSLPTPETVGADRPTVGAELDRQLSLIGDGERGRQARARVRRAVRSVAVETLCEVEGIDEATAERWLDGGEWTSDPRAAAFLGDDSVPRPSVGLRLRDWLSADPTFVRRARAAVAAVERRRGDA
jgi:hypothetical protein